MILSINFILPDILTGYFLTYSVSILLAHYFETSALMDEIQPLKILRCESACFLAEIRLPLIQHALHHLTPFLVAFILDVIAALRVVLLGHCLLPCNGGMAWPAQRRCWRGSFQFI